MKPHSQLLILALLGVQVAAQTSCDPAALGQAAATKAGEDVPAATAAAAAAATTTQDGTPVDAFPDAKILSQAPPIRALSRGNPTVDSLYMMFPALGSLIHWGSLFPAYSFLGAPAPGSEAAASKVVLVLADDAAAKTRVTRQNDPASQPNPFSFLTNFQNLPNMQSFDSTLVGQSLGQSLLNTQNPFSALQNLPGLSNLGMLGAAPPVPVPAPAAPPAADTAEAAPVPAPAATPAAAPAPALGQAWLNFDTNNMLGQTMSLLSQIPPSQASVNLPPANFDFLGQMFPTQAASDISEVRVRPEVAYAPQAQVAQLKIKSALEKETEKEQQQQQGEEQERVPLLWFRMPSNPTTTAEEGGQKTLEDLRVEAKLRAFERQVIAELKMLQKIELMAKEMRSSASPTQGKESPYKISYPLSRTPVHKITRSDIERALRDDYVRRLLQKEAQRKARITQDTQRSAGSYKRQAEKPGQSMSKEDIVQIMAYAYRMASEQMEAAEKGKQDKVYAAYRTDSEEAAKAIEQQEQIQQQQQRQMMQGPQMIQQSPMMIQQQQERQMIQQEQERQMIQQQQQLERQMMADPQAIQQQQRQMMQGPQMIQQTPMMPRQMAETPQMIQQNPMMIQQQQQERQMMANPQAIQQQMQQRQEAEIQQRQMAAEEPQMIQQNPTMMQRQMMAEDSNQQQQQQQQRQMIQQNPTMMQRQMMVEDSKQQQQQRQMIQQNPTMMQRQMLETEPQAIQQMQQRQWAEEQAKIQQNAMMMQQQQPQQPRQMMKDPTQMIQQNPSIMMQQRQMAAENPAIQQQLQWTEDPTRIQQIQQQMQQRSEEQGPMMTMMVPAERQWAEEKTKAIAMQQQMSQPEGQENQETDDDLILGEAGPQMPENEGGARHKGNLYGVFRNRDSISVSPTVDPLGLGGNKRKKSKSKGKSGPPTVVNLYYSTPVQQRPSYGPSYAPPSYAAPSYAPPSYAPRPSYAPSPSYAAPSYGTSYGGGGYGSNAYGAGSSSYQQRPAASAGYRAAVGNEEVDEMLRRHQTLSRTLNPQPDQVARSGSTAAPSLTTTTPAPTPTPPTTAHRVHKRLAIFQSRLGRVANGNGNGDGSNSAAKGCSCGRSQCPCGSSCQCGSSGRGWGASRCPCQGAKSSGNRRQRRSTAEYGTLETIDEGSLNELRREYKMGLKEITLSPDEDPAEALMRYNAASIREALERASQVPLEIGGDQYAEDMPQEPEDAEQMQHQHHHQPHHHQYHYQDFVRLTTTAAPPLSNTTEASVTTEATPTSTSTSTVTPPPRLTDEEEMQQDAAAAETSRVAEAMSQQKEEIHELHKAVHVLKMQLLDANRRCKKIQEQLKVNLVQEPAKEEEEKLEEETNQTEEKDPSQEKEPKVKVEEQAKELVREKEPEKPTEAEEKSGTITKAEEQPEQEEEEEQEEETESTGISTTTTETPPTSPSPPVTTTPSPSPPSPPLTRSKEANAIAKVDEVHGSITAAASASLDANKLAYEEEEEEGNWQRILANRGYDTDYLTKSHERQYAEGGNLELPKGLPYESPLSQEYASYPDFQADEPASPVAADSEGKAKRAAVPLSVKLRAHMLNVALKGSDRRDVATPPTPYALRGKFVRRRSTAAGSSSSGRRRNTRISRMSQEETESPSEQGWVRSTRQARLPQRPKRKVTTPLAKKVTTPLAKKVRPKKQDTVSGRVSTQASVSSTKLDRLVDVLNDLLHLQLQKERRASASKGNAALNALSKPSSSSKLIKRKRVRRRQSTEAPMRM